MRVVKLSPDTAYPDNGCESRGERVAAEGGARVHGPHYLHSLQTHPLQLVIMETSICQYLHTCNMMIRVMCTVRLVHRVYMNWMVCQIISYAYSLLMTTTYEA